MKQNTSRSFVTFFIFLAVMILTISGIFYYIFKHHYLLQVQPDIATESTDALSNPYQGWYHIKGYLLSEDLEIDSKQVKNDTNQTDSNLVLLEINLKEYRDSDLTDKALQDFQTILEGVKTNHKQIILRFLYDWDGLADKTEPSSIRQIFTHMDQVAPLVNRYKDDIYILQGIFVGDYAEMHDSKYMTDSDMTKLAKHLDSVIDSSIFLSVRTPQHYRIINQTYETITAENAFNGTLASRLGLFNDGMLGSVYDLGTYGDTKYDPNSTDYTKKGNREQEIAFQNALCTYVPNGGEAILDNEYNNLINAIPDLSAMHVSYLNIEYDPEVLEKWQNTTYTGDDLFNGCNGLEYIRAHLGYRYLITGCSIDVQNRATFSSTATMNIDIQNTGFSNAYKEMDCTCILVNQETNKVTKLTVDTDNRFWNANETTTIGVELPLTELEEGTYDVYLALHDPDTDSDIEFANSNSDNSYGCSIGSLNISSGFKLVK